MINAKIIADSTCANNVRITTFELEYPRFIHSELMTHRMLSRNAASSRAIPIKKLIEQSQNNRAYPTHWGKHQPGMQAQEETDALVGVVFGMIGSELVKREVAWDQVASCSERIAEAFADAGYHKQIVNRLLEPFTHIKVVVTATDWENFFWLRDHEDAQPEIRELASKMRQQMDKSSPIHLDEKDYHVPYFNGGYIFYTGFNEEEIKEALMISSSCCAQVSYRKSDDSLEKAQKIYDRLIESEPIHASPFEHQATPALDSYAPGITHLRVDGSLKSTNWYSGNFRGWVQYRQTLPKQAKGEE